MNIDNKLGTPRKIKETQRDETRKILVLGHPRCGTKYMSLLFQSYGLNVGHERQHKNGVASWFYAEPYELPKWILELYPQVKTRSNYYYDLMIHVVRDPIKALASIYFTEHPVNVKRNHPSYRFVDDSHMFRARVLHLYPHSRPFLFCVDSFLMWNKFIEQQKIDLTIKVEQAEMEVLEFLKSKSFNISKNVTLPARDINKRPHPTWTKLPWSELDKERMTQLDKFCQKYGYQAVSQKISLSTSGLQV